MLIIVPVPYIKIFVTSDEMGILCNPGSESEKCPWLVLGREGFECTYYCEFSSIHELLKGQVATKQGGCDFIKSLDFSELQVGNNKIIV